jgi:hypothetical protein
MPPWLCPRNTTIELGGSRRTPATRKSCRALGKQLSEDGWNRAAAKPLLRTLGMWKTDLVSGPFGSLPHLIKSSEQSPAALNKERTDPCGL